MALSVHAFLLRAGGSYLLPLKLAAHIQKYAKNCHSMTCICGFLLNFFTGGIGGLQNMMRQFQQGATGNFRGFN